jgi:hypothetical protein
MLEFCRTCCGSWSEDDDAVKLLLVFALAVGVGACRFWYKPVPVANAIGEQKAMLGSDTVNVYREQRFEVYGPNSEAVYDGYEQLNRAYRAFERMFGAPAPRLAVVLSPDTVRSVDSSLAKSFRDRGFTVVEYARPGDFRSPSRYGALGYGGVVWPIAPTAARTMLARFVDAQVAVDGHSDTALLDRLPLWYRAAVIHLVGEAGVGANDLDLVREKRAQLMPIPELLRLVRPSSADSTLDPSRRNDTDDYTRLFAAQSATVARYLVEQEGPAVIGRLGRGYLAGRSLNEMIAEMRSAPRTLQELEQRWKLWVSTSDD